MLTLSLRAWSGQSFEAILGTICILRFTNQETQRAIESSELLRPYLIGRLVPDIIVVDIKRASDLQELLLKAGIQVQDTIQLMVIDKPQYPEPVASSSKRSAKRRWSR